MAATAHLATWATALTPTSLPPEVLHAASRSFYNYTGCAIAGSHHPTTLKALTALSPFFSATQTSSLLGHPRRKADAQHAALLNGIASHVHDYDDTHLETIIHPTGPVASALLAVAEMRGGVSGADFLCALVAGIEVECKLGLAVWPEHYDIGWHITGTVGSVGAAVAVGKVLKLDAEKMRHAVGIASTQVTGLRDMFGSDTKAFHVGRAAQNGLLAAILAESGFTSSEGGLEAKRGWANVVSTRNALAAQMETLGKGDWEVAKNTFKPFPCGIVCHPAIDACIHLKSSLESSGHGIKDVESVVLRVHPLVLELTGKKTPRDGLQGKFSVYHSCAAALLHGRATPAEYSDAIVKDPETVALREKISAEAVEGMAADAAVVEVVVKGGSRYEKEIDHAVGSLEKPMSDKQLADKFVGQCKDVLDAEEGGLGRQEGGEEAVEEVSKSLWKLPDVGDMRDIFFGARS